MNRFLSICALLAGALAAPLPAAQRPGAAIAADIEDALRRHIAILADDAMEGRKPGTPGGDRAVAYIVGQMAAAGLRPGGPDGSWYLPVELVERAPAAATSIWRIGDRSLAFGADAQYWIGRESSARLDDAPVIFAGHGIDDDASGVHNFAGVDLTGAIVLIHPGKPPAIAAAPAYTARAASILARGAAAVVLTARPNDPWDIFLAEARRGETGLAEGPLAAPIRGGLSNPAWGALAAAAGLDPAVLLDAAARPDFRARTIGRASLDVETRLNSYRSWNVAGRLAGTTGEQSVLYLAHWDHLGLCRPAGQADRICNGAVDNASGVAMLIEVARGVASGPRPTRDILFVATTAEEMGLLGAKALAADPPVPLARIVAVINLDTVAIAPAGEPISIVGRGWAPALDAAIDATARRLGRRVDRGDSHNAFVQRQDGWAFSQRGVPAAMVGGAFTDQALLDGFLGGAYHAPDDDLARPLILGGAAEDTAFHVALARILADPASFPMRAAGK